MSKKTSRTKVQFIPMGNRFRDIRLKLGITQDELAERFEVTRTTISLFETGKKGPSLELLYRMIEDFDINLKYLLMGEGEMFNIKTVGSFLNISADQFNEDDQQFFSYYIASPIIRLETLTRFTKVLSRDAKLIALDIERQKMITAEKEKKG